MLITLVLLPKGMRAEQPPSFTHREDAQCHINGLSFTDKPFFDLPITYPQVIVYITFLAPLNQHWPRPRLLLENQPWEEHCSETLLRSSPILQTLITNYYTYTHIYKDMHSPPHPRSRALNRQPDKRVCVQHREWLQDRTAACWSWITSPVAMSCVYGVCAFCC